MDESEDIEGYDPPYKSWNDLDFSVITMGVKSLPFFKDDLYLGMQAMNVGVVDSVVTEYEYGLLREWFEIERTPTETALAVSAMSQMWIYGLYEVLRMWRDRRFQFNKLYQNGGVDLKVASLSDDDPINLTLDVRKQQLSRYKGDEAYRSSINETWKN